MAWFHLQWDLGTSILYKKFALGILSCHPHQDNVNLHLDSQPARQILPLESFSPEAWNGGNKTAFVSYECPKESAGKEAREWFLNWIKRAASETSIFFLFSIWSFLFLASKMQKSPSVRYPWLFLFCCQGPQIKIPRERRMRFEISSFLLIFLVYHLFSSSTIIDVFICFIKIHS